MKIDLRRWLAIAALATFPFAVGGVGVTTAQEYVPGTGYIAEDEWYDPSDWFDGNDLETEDYYDGDADAYADDYYEDDYGYYEYGLDDEYDFDDYYDDDYYDDDYYDDGYYDNYYTDDWYDDDGVFDDWYDTY